MLRWNCSEKQSDFSFLPFFFTCIKAVTFCSRGQWRLCYMRQPTFVRTYNGRIIFGDVRWWQVNLHTGAPLCRQHRALAQLIFWIPCQISQVWTTGKFSRWKALVNTTQPRNICKSRELNYIWNAGALLRNCNFRCDRSFKVNDLEALTDTQLFDAKVMAFINK